MEFAKFVAILSLYDFALLSFNKTSLSTSKPANYFSKISTLASGRTLNDDALISKVSFFTRIDSALAFIMTSSKTFVLGSKYIFPKSLLTKSPLFLNIKLILCIINFQKNWLIVFFCTAIKNTAFISIKIFNYDKIFNI